MLIENVAPVTMWSDALGTTRHPGVEYPRRYMIRFGTLVVLIWLIVGTIAAGQRGYLRHATTDNCAGVGTIAVIVIARALNLHGRQSQSDGLQGAPTQSITRWPVYRGKPARGRRTLSTR
jgi:hypothetical protein